MKTDSHALQWFVSFLGINWRVRVELSCRANLPGQTRTRVNSSFPHNLKGCVSGRIHFSVSTTTCRRTIAGVHSSLLGHRPSPAPCRSWQCTPAHSCQLNCMLCQEPITLWTHTVLWGRATDNQLFLKNIFKWDKHCGLHCSSPDVFSNINLLQSGEALAFAPLLRLACSNQLFPVLMTFNSFNTEVPVRARPTFIYWGDT